MPVVVEINHRGPSPPKIRAQPSLLRRIRKLETAAIAIQPPASRGTGHIKIRQTVPVDVTRANPPRWVHPEHFLEIQIKVPPTHLEIDPRDRRRHRREKRTGPALPRLQRINFQVATHRHTSLSIRRPRHPHHP